MTMRGGLRKELTAVKTNHRPFWTVRCPYCGEVIGTGRNEELAMSIAKFHPHIRQNQKELF